MDTRKRIRSPSEVLGANWPESAYVHMCKPLTRHSQLPIPTPPLRINFRRQSFRITAGATPNSQRFGGSLVMRTLLMGTVAVLALWGAAVAVYTVGWDGTDPSWRALALFLLGSIAVVQLQMIWVEAYRARVNAEGTRQLLAQRPREREGPRRTGE